MFNLLSYYNHRDNSDGLRAEITVRLGATEIHWGQLNLASSPSREGVVKKLAQIDRGLPWREMLDERPGGVGADLQRPAAQYNQVGARDYDAAAAKVLALRRIVQGEAAHPVLEYREAAADQVPAARSENVPLSALYGREDFLTGIPGDVPTPDRQRAAAAVEACGLTWFEAQQLVNATEGPVPDPADELDLEALWGAAYDVNVRLVKDRMTQLRAVDPDLHDRLLPFMHRRANVLAHVLAVAQRLGQGGR